MANTSYNHWYIEGLQALVSASEISEKAAAGNSGAATAPALRAMLEDGARIAGEHTATIRDLLHKAGGEPGGRPNKVMQGIVDAGNDFVGAATDPDVRDAAVVATTQIGLHYYIAAYGTLASAAKHLGMQDHAQALARLNRHISQKNAEYSAFTDSTVGDAASSKAA